MWVVVVLYPQSSMNALLLGSVMLSRYLARSPGWASNVHHVRCVVVMFESLVSGPCEMEHIPAAGAFMFFGGWVVWVLQGSALGSGKCLQGVVVGARLCPRAITFRRRLARSSSRSDLIPVLCAGNSRGGEGGGRRLE